MSVSREDLYEEIWAEPMLHVAARYGVSSSYLSRVCRNLNIPCPPRGYWARWKGVKPRPPSLPPAAAGQDIEWNQQGRAKTEPWPVPLPPKSFSKHLHHSTGTQSHPLVELARATYVREESGYGADYLRPIKSVTLDLHVSKRELSRALEITSRILMDLESNDYGVEIASTREPVRCFELEPVDPKKPGHCHPWHWWSPWRPTVVHIGTVAIALSVYEIWEVVPAKKVGNDWVPLDDGELPPRRRGSDSRWGETHAIPGGRLAIRAISPYHGTKWEQRWCEAKRGEWSEKPPSIIRALESAAPVISDLVTKEWKRQEEERLEREAAHREWLRKEEQRKKEEARREAIRRREQAITNSRNDLLSMVDDWARAIRIEAFFEAVTREAALVPEAGEGHGDSEGAEVLGRHLERARELLGGTDALARFRRWRTPEERLTP